MRGLKSGTARTAPADSPLILRTSFEDPRRGVNSKYRDIGLASGGQPRVEELAGGGGNTRSDNCTRRGEGSEFLSAEILGTLSTLGESDGED